MAEEDFVLKFEIANDRSPSADNVAQALSTFVEILERAAAILEPDSALDVKLVGVEDASQGFRLFLKRLEGHAERVKSGADEYPLISKAAMALATLVGGTLVVNAITPDGRIPDDQMETLEEIRELLEESVEIQKLNQKYYGILQDEPAIDSAKLLEGKTRRVVYDVPRVEFAPRSGLWTGDDEPTDDVIESRQAVWDVVLIRPVAVPEPRNWRFARDGLEFSATMKDKAILQAIHDKTLPIQLAEGVTMKIYVTYRERREGSAWVPVPGSHVVKEVLEPRPKIALPSGGLFAAPDRPEKADQSDENSGRDN